MGRFSNVRSRGSSPISEWLARYEGSAYTGRKVVLKGQMLGRTSPDRVNWTQIAQPLANYSVNGGISPGYDAHSKTYFALEEAGLGFPAVRRDVAPDDATYQRLNAYLRVFGDNYMQRYSRWDTEPKPADAPSQLKVGPCNPKSDRLTLLSHFDQVPGLQSIRNHVKS